MSSMSALAAKTRFGQLLARVERGEEVVITKHDRPVARMVPMGEGRGASVRKVIDDIFTYRAQVKARGNGTVPLTLAEVQSARREGQR
jgi:prevent-host-death family protein